MPPYALAEASTEPGVSTGTDPLKTGCQDRPTLRRLAAGLVCGNNSRKPARPAWREAALLG